MGPENSRDPGPGDRMGPDHPPDPVPGDRMAPNGRPHERRLSPGPAGRRAGAYEEDAAVMAALARARAPEAAAGSRSTAAAEMAPSTRTWSWAARTEGS